ncbi:MAG: glutathione S-transferase N-terminal domain-containing protein [Myxococcota bacterium]|nr:glutathione S-transferase N-terminal domain-containing protein [Myxococcota bacterium]
MTSLPRVLDVGSSVAASLARGLSGVVVVGAPRRRPVEPLVLYDFEACPFCRKVREALTVFDLDAHVRPCPKGGRRFRPEVARRGGRTRFPYLEDPNTGKALYESDAIVAMLAREYGDGRVPRALSLGPLTDLSSSAASLVRLGRGSHARPSRPPARELELWSFEGSPFSRLVRETLCSLEIPYLLRNVGRGSPRRAELVRRAGRMQVPFLVDPGAGVELFESADIVRYLEGTYGGSDARP